MKVYTVEQMKALEQAADEAGHTYEAMMAAAGRGVAQAIMRWAAADAREAVLVLVGPGNNGGDGLVAAHDLAERGARVVAYLWGRDDNEPLVLAARRRQVSMLVAERDEGEQMLRRALGRVGLVVDALFGTGLSRPIEGKAAAILAALRAARGPAARDPIEWIHQPDREGVARAPLLVAVDVPSGLHGDSGDVDPATVPADLTVAFAGPKLGMLTEKALGVLGELAVADIGIDREIEESAAHVAAFLTPALGARLLPSRPASGHKGTFGTTLVVGGSVNYVGAPALSALAAGRSGAGLVTVAVPAPIQPILAARPDLTSATWLLLPHDMGVLRAAAVDVLHETVGKADALVLGPGLGSEEATRRFVWRLLGLEGAEPTQAALGFAPRALKAASVPAPVSLPPTVVDADGLNALASWEGAWWEQVEATLVLTPHPGEMGRLLGRETREIQAARLESAREAAQRFQQVVVLKGAHTVVAAPDGRMALAPFGNDALAKAGTGDLLAGIIGSLLGQGCAPYEAACLGVIAHGIAGQRLRQHRGGQGVLSSDLLDELPATWETLRRLASVA